MNPPQGLFTAPLFHIIKLLLTFNALANAVIEKASGFYKVDLTQTEMNADVIDLLFTSGGADDRALSFPTNV